jgi:hypothetical protein
VQGDASHPGQQGGGSEKNNRKKLRAEEEERHKGSLTQKTLTPGAYPTIASYNASVVNFYNATGSLARFES